MLVVRSLSQRDLPLQEEEVAAVVRLRLDDIEALYKDPAIPAEEWAGGERYPVSVCLADFVPEEDGYLLWAARAARTILAGERSEAFF